MVLIVVLFDVLHINGTDLCLEPLDSRFAILKKLFNPIPNRVIVVPSQIAETKEDIIQAINKAILEKYNYCAMLNTLEYNVSFVERKGLWSKTHDPFISLAIVRIAGWN